MRRNGGKKRKKRSGGKRKRNGKRRSGNLLGLNDCFYAYLRFSEEFLSSLI